MKRILLLLAVFVLMAQSAFAVGTCTQALDLYPNQKRAELIFVCTADASDHTFPATQISTAIYNKIAGWHVEMAETVPSAVTAPTALYDIELNNTYGTDIMGGSIHDRSATVKEQAYPFVGTVYSPRPIRGTETLKISNNLVNSAIVTVIFYVYE